ncbi:MAG: nickel transporter permease [Dehalococcoidia bacterium]|nr:Glutathione transport system permease protein GsiD [Chloroflexota bacterium]MBT9161863.1 Glutathione transport system permease protein GsiD [Chloroflexota bacterium]
MESVAVERAISALIKVSPYAIEVFERLRENRLAVVGLAIVLSLTLVAILAPFIAPHDPIEQNLGLRLLSPSWQYLLGTDALGRCIMSRLIYGTRVSLQIGVMVVGITALLGTLLGLIAGYVGGVVDEGIMRIVDVFLAFPGLILALVIAGLLGPGLFNIMLALSVIGWTGYARVVRGCVLSAKERGFVEATRALGGSNLYIMFRHVLPEALSPVIVMATLGMGGVILSTAALSFLGLGAQPPMPEWGSMLSGGRAFMRTAPHLTIFPGLAIMVTILSLNFLGDGLRDALDPRQKRKLEI